MERLAGRIMLLGGWGRAVLALLAGAFGALAMPPVSFFAALFFSFTLLVWLMDGVGSNPERMGSRGLRSAFLIGWLFGLGYFVAGLWWVGAALLLEADEFAWALPLAVLGLPAVLAIFYGVATAFARLFWSDGLGRIAALAAAFGLAEWLRSFVATGFPWNAIGYGAMPVPVMMQSVRVFGLFGMSALSVFVFAVPALFATRRGLRPGIALALLLLAGHFGYGAYQLHLSEATGDGQEVTVRLVQPAIDQSVKLQNSDRVAVFEKHLRLTALPPEAGGRQPDIIVWPETTIPFILTENPDALQRIAAVLKEGQVLVTGTVRSEEQAAGEAPLYYNSIYVIDHSGQILSATDKVHLTPFGEYVPWENLLKRFGIENLVALPGGFTAGARRNLLTLPNGLKLYPLICYEVIFPQVEDEALSQSDLIVNVTNDAWFGNTPGPYQHFLQARMKAVESGRFLIRDANNGISATIDPQGRVVSGLGLNAEGAKDISLRLRKPIENGLPSPNYNFWMVTALLLSGAVISRLGFVSKGN
ncbi:apolipoprotein N-acyltransferase [Rhizobium paknamense]|nr:apolipoprotein N-acyltransferase [Rhizobium paknamense]